MHFEGIVMDLYEMLSKQDDFPKDGWTYRNVFHVVSIDNDGKLIGIFPLSSKVDITDSAGEVKKQKTLDYQRILLPAECNRTSGKKASFLCDNEKYTLGIALKKNENGKEYLDVFKKQQHDILDAVDNPIVKIFLRFIDDWDPEMIENCPDALQLVDKLKASKQQKAQNIIFRVGGQYLHEEEDVIRAWNQYYASEYQKQNSCNNGEQAQCLITGKTVPIVELHRSISGLGKSGAKLVSCNCSAFESYEKEHGMISPCGFEGMNAYVNVLTYLVSQSRYCKRMGNSWYLLVPKVRKENTDSFLDAVFGDFKEKEGSTSFENIQSVFQNLANGLPDSRFDCMPDEEYYFFNVSVNSTRIVPGPVLKNTFGETAKRMMDFYEALNIKRPEFAEGKTFSFNEIAYETFQADSTKKERCKKQLFDAVIYGHLYPREILIETFKRILAKSNVTWRQASILKLYYTQSRKEKLTMALDQTRKDPAYIWGRLFEVCEEIQETAMGNIQSNIRSRFFGAAMNKPTQIHAILNEMMIVYLEKIKVKNPGLKCYYEELLEKLNGSLDALPKTMSFDEKSAFCIAYYCQKEFRFTKKEKKENNNV